MATATIGEKIWGFLIALAGFALIIVAIGTFGWHCISWLKDGYWTDFDLKDLMEGPVRTRDLYGLNEILYWLGRRSAALGAFLAGWALFVSGSSIMEGR